MVIGEHTLVDAKSAIPNNPQQHTGGEVIGTTPKTHTQPTPILVLGHHNLQLHWD
jgi:hypothetical protein